MELIDKQYMETPFYGSRRITFALAKQGCEVNGKRVQRLMRLMDLEAIYPKKTHERLGPLEIQQRTYFSRTCDSLRPLTAST